MGIFVRNCKETDCERVLAYLQKNGLMLNQEDPLATVMWFNDNAIVCVIESEGNIVGAAIGRRHSVDDFSQWTHDNNGDVLFVRELAADSHEVAYAIYRLFLKQCLENGYSLPNVIRFQRNDDKERKNRIFPIMQFFRKF